MAWQPTPAFFPEESQWTEEPGSPWGPKEVDMTEGLSSVQNEKSHYEVYNV